jgi:hypothetical protein
VRGTMRNDSAVIAAGRSAAKHSSRVENNGSVGFEIEFAIKDA